MGAHQRSTPEMNNDFGRFIGGLIWGDSLGQSSLGISDHVLRNCSGACGGMFIQSIDGSPAQALGLKSDVRHSRAWLALKGMYSTGSSHSIKVEQAMAGQPAFSS